MLLFFGKCYFSVYKHFSLLNRVSVKSSLHNKCYCTVHASLLENFTVDAVHSVQAQHSMMTYIQCFKDVVWLPIYPAG